MPKLLRLLRTYDVLLHLIIPEQFITQALWVAMDAREEDQLLSSAPAENGPLGPKSFQQYPLPV